MVGTPSSHGLLQDLTGKKTHQSHNHTHLPLHRPKGLQRRTEDLVIFFISSLPLSLKTPPQPGGGKRGERRAAVPQLPPCDRGTACEPRYPTAQPTQATATRNLHWHRPLFSNLYSQEVESPKCNKRHNSFPWTLIALLNTDLNKVFCLYAKTPYFCFSLRQLCLGEPLFVLAQPNAH